MSTLTRYVRIDGDLADPHAIKLSNEGGTAGVWDDQGGVVVADDTALVKGDTGVYAKTFTDPDGYHYPRRYTYALEVVWYDGEDAHYYEGSMAAPVPSGETNRLWGPIENLRTLIAMSTTFQTLVGEVDTDGARDHVYCPMIFGADVAAARPFAIVGGHERYDARQAGAGAYGRGGLLTFDLEADVPAGHSGETTAKYATAEQWFNELLGDVISEMIDAASQQSGSPLDVASIGLAQRPGRTAPEDVKAEGDRFWGIVEVRWGMQG